MSTVFRDVARLTRWTETSAGRLVVSFTVPMREFVALSSTARPPIARGTGARGVAWLDEQPASATTAAPSPRRAPMIPKASRSGTTYMAAEPEGPRQTGLDTRGPLAENSGAGWPRLRKALGLIPVSRLKTRVNASSEAYPTDFATWL